MASWNHLHQRLQMHCRFWVKISTRIDSHRSPRVLKRKITLPLIHLQSWPCTSMGPCTHCLASFLSLSRWYTSSYSLTKFAGSERLKGSSLRARMTKVIPTFHVANQVGPSNAMILSSWLTQNMCKTHVATTSHSFRRPASPKLVWITAALLTFPRGLALSWPENTSPS